jgi:hypothetical protein
MGAPSRTVRGLSASYPPSSAVIPCTPVSPYRCIGGFEFNTHQLVKDLIGTGLTEEQSEAVTTAVSQIIGMAFMQLHDELVSKQEQVTHEKEWRAELQKSANDSARLKLYVEKQDITHRDDIKRLEAGHRLDFSLEKGRVDSAVADSERRANETHARLLADLSAMKAQLEIKILRQESETLNLVAKSDIRISKLEVDFHAFRDAVEKRRVEVKWYATSAISLISLVAVIIRFFVMGKPPMS